MEVCRAHGLHGIRSDLLVIDGFPALQWCVESVKRSGPVILI